MKRFIYALLTLLFLTFSQGFALDKITINGKKYSCKGEISVENNTVVCAGTALQSLPEKWWMSETETVCGNEQVIQHEKGGGMKSVRANVQKGAFLDKESVVCGTSTIKSAVKIKGASKVSGDVRVLGNSEIIDSILSGVSEVHSSTLSNVKMMGASTARASRVNDSTLLGASKVVQGKISDQSTLSGSVEVNNSEIIGSTVSGASLINNNSIVKNSTLSGAINVRHGKLDGCLLTGVRQFINQTCEQDRDKY